MTVGVALDEYAESDSVSCWFCSSSLLIYLSRSAAVGSLSDIFCFGMFARNVLSAGLCSSPRTSRCTLLLVSMWL